MSLKSNNSQVISSNHHFAHGFPYGFLVNFQLLESPLIPRSPPRRGNGRIGSCTESSNSQPWLPVHNPNYLQAEGWIKHAGQWVEQKNTYIIIYILYVYMYMYIYIYICIHIYIHTCKKYTICGFKLVSTRSRKIGPLWRK